MINAVVNLLLLCTAGVYAQHQVAIDAVLDTKGHALNISQTVNYVNNSASDLDYLLFVDWANSFSSKTTPLAQRFSENFESAFHFEKQEQRGATTIGQISSGQQALSWSRPAADILKITLDQPLAKGATLELVLDYSIKIPDDKYTRFGVNNNDEYTLRYWFIAPGLYQNGWQVYSHKDTEDFIMARSAFQVNIDYPADYRLYTDLSPSAAVSVTEPTVASSDRRLISLNGERHNEILLVFAKDQSFTTYNTAQFSVVTDMTNAKVPEMITEMHLQRIAQFLSTELGAPTEKLDFLVTQAAYKKNPVYGLNQLPDFISPFPNGFEEEMSFLKIITRLYLERHLAYHARRDYWLIGGLQVYLMAEYVQQFYPDQKILGTFSSFPLVKWSHLSGVKYNDQYPLLYLNSARKNRHQALSIPKDSLLNFNARIGNDYYAGTGFQVLEASLGRDEFKKLIKLFFQKNKYTVFDQNTLKKSLSEGNKGEIDWFFEDFAKKRQSIDFKITEVSRHSDSLKVTVLNRSKKNMPVALYGLAKDSLIFKKWLSPFSDQSTVVIPESGIEQLVINRDGIIPEINARNNFKNVSGSRQKPLQIRLIQDIEDPKYNQIFLLPALTYNLYDGVSLGAKVYNRTILPKKFHYNLKPQYGTKSQTFIGSGSLVYNQFEENQNLYMQRYGVSGTYFSFDEQRFYRRLSPYVVFAFRDHNDLRKNRRHFINLRSVHVTRDKKPEAIEPEPNYSVYNLQYTFSDNNLINYYNANFNLQWSNVFTKISTQLEYRKLYLNNRQINLRLFSGLFLRNNTRQDQDYFNFALDRPTDYMFDYSYLGRSESSGIYSQQLVISEGGFKSDLDPGFANQWITTINTSVNMWRWIYAYGDLGMVKNLGSNAKFVYDSGIRASFVTDYFELYFPLYSNLGWEPGLDHYASRIRFIATLDIQTLSGLFTRKWY